jgi:hypothetical protein
MLVRGDDIIQNHISWYNTNIYNHDDLERKIARVRSSWNLSIFRSLDSEVDVSPMCEPNLNLDLQIIITIQKLQIQNKKVQN